MSKTLRTSCRLMTRVYFFLFTTSFTVPFFKRPLYILRQEPCAPISSLVCNFALILLIRQPLGHENLLVVTNWWPHKGVTVFLKCKKFQSLGC